MQSLWGNQRDSQEGRTTENYPRAFLTKRGGKKWRNSFVTAIGGQAEVGRFLGTKGLEELNPLKVLDLFKRMPAEVRTASLSLSHSLTTLVAGLRIGRSQADSCKTGRVLVAIYSRTSCCNTTFGCSRRGQVGHSFHGSVLVSDISLATKMTSPSNWLKLYSQMR